MKIELVTRTFVSTLLKSVKPSLSIKAPQSNLSVIQSCFVFCYILSFVHCVLINQLHFMYGNDVFFSHAQVSLFRLLLLNVELKLELVSCNKGIRVVLLKPVCPESIHPISEPIRPKIIMCICCLGFGVFCCCCLSIKIRNLLQQKPVDVLILILTLTLTLI